MTRTEVIQKIISKRKAHTYLEIGVNNGLNFFSLNIKRKIAVDPDFLFERKDRIKWMLKNFYNIPAKFYEITSDVYFQKKKIFPRLDVVFIDGLHTYQQSLQDIKNTLDHLEEKGVIILHDCNPPHEAAAVPANSLKHAISKNIECWTDEWCGDVWKTICYLRSYREDLKIFVLDCDYGLGIITKGKSFNKLNLTEEQLLKMTYADLAKNKDEYLNLKNESYLFEFLNSEK